MVKAKNTPIKKPRGKVRILTLSPDLDEWLIEKTQKAEDVYYVQEVIRDILKAARDAERQGQAA